MERVKKPYSKPTLKIHAAGTPEYERIRAAAIRTGNWPAGKAAEPAGTPYYANAKGREEL